MGSSSTARWRRRTPGSRAQRRRRSPPERPASGFSACSPLNRKRPSSARALLGVSPVARCAASSTVPPEPSSSVCWERKPTLTLWPVRSLPAGSGRRPVSVSTSVVLPDPLGPTSDTCSPRSSHSSTSSSSTIGGSPTSIRACSSSKVTRPLRSGASKRKDSAAPSAGARSIRSIFSSALTRDCAWRARVPAPQRATKRSRRSISACWRSIARPSASSRAACSARQACQVPGKKRARPASSSSTAVPTVSRNQRSCATSAIAASSDVSVCSSHSSDSMSRWLVGSSSSSRSGLVASARASEARVSSPPEKVARPRSRSSS